MYYTNLKTSENFWFFSLNKRTVTENWRKIYKISMKWKMHTGRWGSKLLPITAPLICFTGQHIERLAPPSHFPQMFQFQDWGTLSLNTCLILCKGQCEQNKTRHNNHYSFVNLFTCSVNIYSLGTCYMLKSSGQQGSVLSKSVIKYDQGKL